MKLTARAIAALPAAPPRTVEYRDEELTGFLLRCLAAPSTSRTYFVRYTSPETGRRQHFRLGTTATLTPAQARDAAERALGTVALGTCPQAERGRTRAAALEAERTATEARRLEAERTDRLAATRFGRIVEGPYANPERRGRPRRLAEMVGRVATNFGHWFELPVEAITEELVERWARDRKAGAVPVPGAARGKGGETRTRRPAGETTIRRDVQDLKSVLTFAVGRGLLAGPHALEGFEPFERVAEDEERVRYLSADEERRLRAALTAHTARLQAERASANAWRRARHLPELPSEVADYLPVMVLLSLNTGLRRGEVFTLRWDAVDFAHRRVIVRAQYAKNRRAREIPMNAEALAVLNRWHTLADRPAAGLVFVSPKTGGQFGHIKSAWARLVADAELADFRFHDLRHDFASKLVSKGVPLFDVGELLGHRDTATTRRYAHLAPDRMAAAVAKLERPALRSVG